MTFNYSFKLFVSQKWHIFFQIWFAFLVYFSSFLEIISFFCNQYENYMLFVPILDVYIVGPLLTLSCISGIFLAKKKYKKKIPKHIHQVIQKLFYFGIFWACFDKTTQGSANFYIRCVINSFSCFLVYHLQTEMRKSRIH